MLDQMTAMEIGRLQGMFSTAHEATNRRIDDVVKHLGGRISRLEALMHKRKPHRTSSPWLQIAAMGAIALSSIAGLVKPEAAAAILRALLH